MPFDESCWTACLPRRPVVPVTATRIAKQMEMEDEIAIADIRNKDEVFIVMVAWVDILWDRDVDGRY